MMGLVATIILIALLLVGFSLIRRRKHDDKPTNRYRDYHTPTTTKKPKMRRNRYHHKTTRHEPDLEDPSPDKKETIVEPVRTFDDPDVVLGLKEPSHSGREKPIPNEAQITLKPPPPPPPIITFYVMAEEGRPFSGYELLQAILSIGARFGAHQIFHRHQEKTGHGPVLFSLASAVSPGTFDLSKMGGFSTPGLSLFFCAGDVEDPMVVYELMLQTAGQLMEDLGGHVLDEHRQLLTPTMVINQRRQLREYLQGQQVPDLFEETVE